MSQQNALRDPNYEQRKEKIFLGEEEKTAHNPKNKNDHGNILFKFNNYTRKTSKNIPLLKNVSFEVPEGKLIALIGLSGEGKSTLFESIAGRCSESHKTYGEVLVKTQKNTLTRRKAEKWTERVNYHMQEITQYRRIEVYTLLCSVARCYGRNTRMIDELLEYFRVSKTKYTLFCNLSGGEQKRIMTIIGIISEKELNLWDEPLTGLDSEIAKKTLYFMKGRDVTNIVSVHQPSEEIMNLFDWVVFMNSSTVIYAGPYSTMAKYFAKKGIKPSENVLLIDYLMRLSAENIEQPEDTENIRRMRDITDSILLKQEEEETEKNIFLTKSYAISSVRVREIVRRSFYFDRGFKGSSIVFEVGYYAFWILMLSIICIIAERTIFSYNDELLKRFFFDPLYGIMGVIEDHMGSAIPGLEEYREVAIDCLKTVASTKWLSGAVYFFQTEKAFTFMGMVSLYSTLFNTDYYRLCKLNIAEGQFTAGDFILAQALDVCVRKMPLAFLFSIFSYCILYSTLVNEYMGGIIHPNIFEMLIVTAIGSVILCLYVLAIHISPISSKVYIYLGTMVLLCMQTIVLQLESLSYFLDSNVAKMFSDIMQGRLDMNSISTKSFVRENHPFYDFRFNMLQKKVCFLDGLAEDMEKSGESYEIKKFLIRTLAYTLKSLYRIGPFSVNEELITKIQLYNNRIYQVESTDELAKYLLMNSNYYITEEDASIEEIDKRRAIMYIADMGKEMNFHEFLLPKELINKVSFLDLVQTVLRGLFLPICILAVVGFLKYRKIQPKLRN